MSAEKRWWRTRRRSGQVWLYFEVTYDGSPIWHCRQVLGLLRMSQLTQLEKVGELPADLRLGGASRGVTFFYSPGRPLT